MPGVANNRSEVDIQRDDKIASSGYTQTLFGQRQSRIHRSGRSCQCTRRKGNNV